MQLQPARQPGRNDRKAASYVEEILRLRAQGYTYEAIREALADVGVVLSITSLRREVVRRQLQPGSLGRERIAAVAPTSAGQSSLSMSTRSSSPGAPSGRQIAEAFFDAHPSNPLLRATDKS